MSRVQLNNVSVSFKKKKILDKVNIEIDSDKEDSFVFLTGESGAGKSTVLSMLYFNLLPHSGNISIELDKIGKFNSSKVKHKDIVDFRQNIGIIFQNFKLQDHLSVKENLSMVLEYLGYNKIEIRRRTDEALDIVSMKHKAEQIVDSLSGGEKQRVASAIVFAKRPSLILADEPTGNLDYRNSVSVVEYLKKYNKLTGVPVIFATHDFDILKNYKSPMLVISDKSIVKLGADLANKVVQQISNEHANNEIGD